MKKWSVSGVNILTPEELIRNGCVQIANGKFINVSNKAAADSASVTVGNGILVPGLINGHDHLLGTYWPKVGNGPYENWLPWDNDLKSSPIYEERQQVENRDLYLLGAYRNLVSGVTTVSDHIPHFVAEPYYDILPMKAIRYYALAHSIASFALAWGDGVAAEYQKAVKDNIPFITHIAEGFDSETVNDLKTIDRNGGLGDHSVFVHGIAFTETDMKLIKAKGASVVWCADSNMFMFNNTAKIKKLLETGVNVCIGTDSPMSGGVNLLTEIKFDKKLYKRLYDEELPDRKILSMITVNAAKAFWMKNSGRIKDGYIADFVIFKDRGDSSAASVVAAGLADVLLVVIDGVPAYGDARFSGIFDSFRVKYQKAVIDGAEKVIKGDLIGLMKRISRAVGYKKEFPFMPVEFEMD